MPIENPATVISSTQKKVENLHATSVIQETFSFATRSGIKKVIAFVDQQEDADEINEKRRDCQVIWLTTMEETISPKRNDPLLVLRKASLTRSSQMRLGLFRSLLRGFINPDEAVICVSGLGNGHRVDTMSLTTAQRDLPAISKRNLTALELSFAHHSADVVEVAISTCLRFAAEGREGRPIGTIFLIGEPAEMDPYLQQLILNPFKGHPKKDRHILHASLIETLREYAALDGAFVLSNKGILERAGTYINISSGKLRTLPGLGARHASAAALTAQTNILAIVLSESSGTLRVFFKGKTILELDKEYS